MSQPWTKPDLRDTWEVSNITNPRAFMRFVFTVSPPGSAWVVVNTGEKAFDRLARIYKRDPSGRIAVPLTPESQLKWDDLLRDVAALVEHHVYHGARLVMCSYDNLSCCWLSKAIGHDLLNDASRTHGFRFTDPDAA